MTEQGTYVEALQELASENSIVPLMEAAQLRAVPATRLSVAIAEALRLARLQPQDDRGYPPEPSR